MKIVEPAQSTFVTVLCTGATHGPAPHHGQLPSPPRAAGRAKTRTARDRPKQITAINYMICERNTPQAKVRGHDQLYKPCRQVRSKVSVHFLSPADTVEDNPKPIVPPAISLHIPTKTTFCQATHKGALLLQCRDTSDAPLTTGAGVSSTLHLVISFASAARLTYT